MVRKIMRPLAGLLLLWSVTGKNADAADKIVIGYPTTSSQFAPLWYAKDAGIYQKYGLDADLVYVRGFNLVQAMLAGEVNVAQTAVEGPVLAIVRGGNIRFLGLTAQIFPYTLIAGKGVKSAKDLKGGKIAINKLADASELASRLALRKLGLDDKDVTMVQVGGSPQRLAALQSGSVQGAALDFMSSLRLAREGYNVLVQINPTYPYLGLVAGGRFMRENASATEAFVRAFMEAVGRFKKNRDEGIKAIARYMKSNDMDIVSKAYDFIATKFYSENLEPDPKIFRTFLNDLASTEPKLRNISPNEMFDLSIVRKLEKEGFFRTVFSK